MKKIFRNLKIRFKLLGGYTLIFIFATLMGGAVIYSTVRATIENNIESELTHSTEAILDMVRTAASTSIKNYLRAIAEENRQIVAGIYQDCLDGRISQAEAKKQARRILFSQTIGKTGYIFCADSRGIAVEHPNSGVAGKNFMDRAFVRKMIAMKQGYLEYEWKNPEDRHERPKAMYMVYFKPWDWIISVSSYREEFRELIHISDFKKNILSLKFGRSGYAYIIDTKGNLVVHPFLSGNYFDAADRDGKHFVKNLCHMKNGKMFYRWKNPGERDEREKMVIFRYIPEYDWIIASTSYLDEIFSPLKTIRDIIAITTGLLIIFVFILSLMINHIVVSPLKSLMLRFESGASGNLSVRMPVESEDEIGQLAQYFNDFMEKLEAYSTSLESEIEKHRQTEQFLKISEEKYRTILERMAEGYFEIDTAGCFLFFNRAMKNMLGLAHTTPSGLRIQSFLKSTDQTEFADFFRKIMDTGKPGQISDIELLKNGESACYVEISMSPVRQGDKDLITGFSGVVRDISERRKREQALRLSEEIFSKAFRNSPGGMFIATLKDTRLINVNDSFLKITGFTLFDLIGNNLSELKFFSSPARAGKFINAVRHGNRVKNMETGFFNAQGEKRTGVISAEIVNVWEEPCMLVVLEDTTESRLLERQILSISENERRRIAMDLHDDLCPQLIGIEFMVKILTRRLCEESSTHAQEAEKIRALILDSIEKTRQLSSGLFPANLSDHGLISCLEALASATGDFYGIKCSFESHGRCCITDHTCISHIYYIVHEAVHNAVKHAHTEKIAISLTNTDETVTLHVRDEGIGINDAGRSAGMGMKLMQYRASRIGAVLTITRPACGGTLVKLEIEAESCLTE